MSIRAWPQDLLSLEDWDRLPEDNSRHYELEEGTLRVSPRPVPRHQWVISECLAQLRAQLPAHLVVLPEIEIVVFDLDPPTVRAPDLVVVEKRLVRSNFTRYRASDVRLVIEVLSPGTVRTDQITKFAEYAEAGIKNYWMIDPRDGEAELAAYHLTDGDYVLKARTKQQVDLTCPVPLTVNPAGLLP